jgi:hypothetical protein
MRKYNLPVALVFTVGVAAFIAAIIIIAIHLIFSYQELQAEKEAYHRQYNPPAMSVMCRIEMNCLECHSPQGKEY